MLRKHHYSETHWHQLLKKQQLISIITADYFFKYLRLCNYSYFSPITVLNLEKYIWNWPFRLNDFLKANLFQTDVEFKKESNGEHTLFNKCCNEIFEHIVILWLTYSWKWTSELYRVKQVNLDQRENR